MTRRAKKLSVIVRETGLQEKVCEHGVGHPILSSAREIANKLGHPVKLWMTHGCDGCCTARDGYTYEHDEYVWSPEDDA